MLSNQSKLTGVIWFATFVLVACTAVVQEQVTPTTSMVLLPPTLEDTALPLPEILKLIPLEVGLTRIYSVTTETSEYSSELGKVVLEQTSMRIITETVTRSEYSDGKWRFDIKGDAYAGTYEVTDDYLYGYTFDTYEIDIRWPLVIDQTWDTRGYENMSGVLVPNWLVYQMKDIQTAAGTFVNCYGLLSQRQTSGLELWLCPGVGIVQVYSSSSGYGTGPAIKEFWELSDVYYQ